MNKVLTAAALVAFLAPAIAMAESNGDQSSMGPSDGIVAYNTASADNARQATVPSARHALASQGFYNLPDGGSDAKSTNITITGGPVTDALSASAGSGSY